MSEVAMEAGAFDKMHALLASAQGLIYTFLRTLLVGTVTAIGFILGSGAVLVCSTFILWAVLAAMAFFGVTFSSNLIPASPYGP